MVVLALFRLKNLWLPQVFEDEGGLAGGIVMLAWIIASLCELSLQFLVACNPTTKMSCSSVCTCSREIGYS